MPTVLLLDGFRFFFYSREGAEPPHVHVAKGDAIGKIWLEPVLSIAYLVDFTPAERKQIWEIVQQQVETFKRRWYEYHGR